MKLQYIKKNRGEPIPTTQNMYNLTTYKKLEDKRK